MTTMPSRYQSSPQFLQNYHSPLEVGRCAFDNFRLAPRLRKQRYATWHLKRRTQEILRLLTLSRENRAVWSLSRVRRAGSDLIKFLSPPCIFIWTTVCKWGKRNLNRWLLLVWFTYSLKLHVETLQKRSCDCSLKVEPSQNRAPLVLFLQWFKR